MTLVESTRADHREDAERLIEAILPATGKATRIGISGPPGAGKSTFIERFGLDGIAPRPPPRGAGGRSRVEARRRRDPRRQDADGRAGRAPPPLSGRLRPGAQTGGVARRTREAILVCEAAGFDTVIVETVGAGQSETTVADMVDMFVLILPPAAGDELQGIKRGIIEFADLILVNKADGDLARRTPAPRRRLRQRDAPDPPRASPNGRWRCARSRP